MAINTPDRRASAAACGLAFLVILPLPNADIGRGDRVQVAGFYRGVMEDLTAQPTVVDLVGSAAGSLALSGSSSGAVERVGSYTPTASLIGTRED